MGCVGVCVGSARVCRLCVCGLGVCVWCVVCGGLCVWWVVCVVGCVWVVSVEVVVCLGFGVCGCMWSCVCG